MSQKCTLCDGNFTPGNLIPKVPGLPSLIQTCGDYNNAIKSTNCEGINDNHMVRYACDCPPVDECKFCDGSFKASNSLPIDAFLFADAGYLNITTCGQYSNLVAQWNNESVCEKLHNIPLLMDACECIVENPCTLCEGNFTPSIVIPSLPNSSQYFPDNMKTCGDFASAMGHLKNDSSVCNSLSEQVLIQSKCGCPNLPESSCTLCGGKIPDLKKIIAGDVTCKDGIALAANAGTPDECKEVNAVVGAACDCPNIPIPSCAVLEKCPEGKYFSFATSFSQETPCGEALLDASIGKTKCDHKDFVEKCCINNPPSFHKLTDIPTVSPTEEPTSASLRGFDSNLGMMVILATLYRSFR